MSKFFGLEKLGTLRQIIQQHGGIKGTFLQLFRRDEAKLGNLVGEDKFGNKYYENPRYFYGRNRWVYYSEKFGWDYDASQVPSEWFGWLHYKTDIPPQKDPNRPKYKWMEEGNENFSGTNLQYVPYSTTTPKIKAWTPPRKS